MPPKGIIWLCAAKCSAVLVNFVCLLVKIFVQAYILPKYLLSSILVVLPIATQILQVMNIQFCSHTHTHTHTHVPPVLDFAALFAFERSIGGLDEYSIDSFYTHKLSSLNQKNTPSTGTFHPRCTHAFHSLFLDINFKGILCSVRY